MDKRVDLTVATGFLAFGFWLLVASFRIPQGSVPDSIGSGGVARVLAVVIILAAGYLVGRRVVAWRRTSGVTVPADGSTDNPDHPASARRGLGMFGLLVAYAFGVRYLGYPIATPIFVAAALYVMGLASWVRLVTISVLYTVATYALFVGFFGVLLPLGVLSTWDYYLWFHF
jgi:tripartite tricarboxylate transporter TctB family protein